MSNYYQNLTKRNRQRSKRRNIILVLLVFLVVGGLAAGYMGYRMLYKPNVWTDGKESMAFNIKSGATWDDVKQMLYAKGTIIHRESFEQMANLMKYPKLIKPGHYLLKENMSNRMLISKLRAGKQDPVKLVFNNIRTKHELAGQIAEQIEADSISILKKLEDIDYLKTLGFTNQNIMSMFIPNTYEVYWNITAEKFLERMHKEHKAFWNEKRTNRLKVINLSQLQAYTLASIVEKETNQIDEKPDVAGVYINRLHDGWLLQADPTLVYALGDFSIKRVLNVYKTIDSPYNTYKYFGLPPGPICLPSISSIDAVLNYRQHKYMYFCAREDFSGYHNFAVTLNEHLLNAAKYQQALDQRGIMK